MTIDENLHTLQLNLVAPVALSHAALGGMLRRGRGYRDHEYLLLKVQKATATRRLRRTA